MILLLRPVLIRRKLISRATLSRQILLLTGAARLLPKRALLLAEAARLAAHLSGRYSHLRSANHHRLVRTT